MAKAMDFKDINSKKYRLWRILQSNPHWSAAYRERDGKYHGFKSALIFPEQILGLNQNRIWHVTSTASTNQVSITIQALHNFNLYGDGDLLKTLDDILEFERDQTNKRKITVGSTLAFTQLSLFSNMGDATRYGEKVQRQLLSKYC